MDCWISWFSLSRIGLLYDIFGVVILALGFLLIGPKDFRNAKLALSAKPEMEKLGYAKVDAYFGVALIALGFLLQLLGSDDLISTSFRNIGNIGPIILITVLCLAFIAFLIFRAPLAKREISRSEVAE